MYAEKLPFAISVFTLGGIASYIRLTTASISTGPLCASAAREARLNVLRMFEANAAHADSFRHRRESWVLKIRAHIEEPARLLLEFDEAKCAVIEYHDLDVQAELVR
jgi:hypothetical protein